MINRILATLALGTVQGALLVMFAPWMRDFSRWNTDPGGLAAGTGLVFAACFLAITPVRNGMIAAGAIIVISAAIDVAVLSLPATLGLVPNVTAFYNNAQYMTAFTCITASPFVALGGIVGALAHAAVRRAWS